MTQAPNHESTFSKYRVRGAYHWAQVSRSPRAHNAFVAARYEAVVRAADDLVGARLLDLGCGDGALSYRLERAGARVVGIDLDPTGLAHAAGELTARGSRVALVRGGADGLPFADASLDVVVCSDVIEHVARPLDLLVEVRRVLLPGGRLVLTTPCRTTEEVSDVEHVQEFFPGELETLLTEAGYCQCHVAQSHPVAVTDWYQWVPRRLARRPLRLLINLLSILGHNPFHLRGLTIHSLLVATATAPEPMNDA